MTDYKNSAVTYSVTSGFLTDTVAIKTASGTTIATVYPLPGNVVTGSSSDVVLADALGSTFVTVPGSTGDIDIVVNALAYNTFYIGGDTAVTFAVNAISGQTFNIYGGDLTLSSGLVASALSGSTINIGYGGTYSSGGNLASILTGATINFTTGGGTLILNAGGTLLNLGGTTITGYDPSKDTIELENTTQTISGYVISGSGTSRAVTLYGATGTEVASYTVSLASGATLNNGTYNALSTDTSQNPLQISYSDGNTYVGACFLAGSMIRTPAGDRAVEDIRAGDPISVFDWRSSREIVRDVVWTGHKKVFVREGFSDDEAGWPVRVLKDAIADGVPYKDMLITAEHCLFFEDKFIPVRMLVNGASIFYDRTITSYEYYHIETTPHSVIWADGMLTESYLDTGNRASFRQRGNVVRFGGAIASWNTDGGAELAVAREVVEPLFRRLEARARWTDDEPPARPALTDDTALCLITDTGATIGKVREGAGFAMFMIPPHVTAVRLVSRSSRPCDITGPFVDDRRRLGVLVGEVTLYEAGKPRTISQHLTASDLKGWHAAEEGSGRWTDGEAVLLLGQRRPGSAAMLAIQILAAGPYLASEEGEQAVTLIA